MNPKAPCKGCAERTADPNCHSPERCEKWAEYYKACQVLREARAEYGRTWCYKSGRDKNITQKLKERQRKRMSTR